VLLDFDRDRIIPVIVWMIRYGLIWVWVLAISSYLLRPSVRCRADGGNVHGRDVVVVSTIRLYGGDGGCTVDGELARCHVVQRASHTLGD